jgi:hypothetical protein
MNMDGHRDEVLLCFLDEGRKNHQKRLAAEKKAVGGRNSTNVQDPVNVRSCFGGITTYRADVWLKGSDSSGSQCRYDIHHKNDIQYASKFGFQTCEHVVFHECLRRKLSFQPYHHQRELRTERNVERGKLFGEHVTISYTRKGCWLGTK